MSKRTATVLIALVISAIAPQAAHASHTQGSVFEDDTALVTSDATERDRSLDELQSLGVDTIRSLVIWNRVAPDPTSATEAERLRRDRSRTPTRAAPGTPGTRSSPARRSAA